MRPVRVQSPPVGNCDGELGRTAATLLLIRHAHTDALGQWLAGRTDESSLNHYGRRQAIHLGRALEDIRFAAIYSSPLRRARETAAAVARRQTARVEVYEPLTEIDFGSWTGRSFDELNGDPAWTAFNEARSTAAIPDGETPSAAQARAVAALSVLAARHCGQTIAIVSHADVLRFAILHYAGLSLDEYYRFDIGPASVSNVELSPAGGRIVSVNACVADRRQSLRQRA